MSCLESIAVEPTASSDAAANPLEVVLLEPRPFRPFKSSEEYLIAMKEDIADWLQRLYSPQLKIDIDNFMEVLEDGTVLCKHANNVRKTAVAYKEKLEQQGDQRDGQSSCHLAIPEYDVLYRPEVKPKSFFARDNVHNFIQWCRSLGIFDCLLFETDDLVLRKNEKSFILCLLEVARRGAHFGMPAPMLVQFEKEIDCEMAKENNLDQCGDEDEKGEELLVEFGPKAQIVLNDLRSLDEMVRDLVASCSCPIQFPMIRVSEGKYRIGDTKMLIFVRVLKRHVMVRVGGGWDTLSHFLEKHDPCRCRAGHRTLTSSKLSVGQDSQGAIQMAVNYERASSPVCSRRSSSGSINDPATPVGSRKNSANGLPGNVNLATGSPPVDASTKNRPRPHQRSPSPSTSKLPLRQGIQPPASPPIFQRTGSRRYYSSTFSSGRPPTNCRPSDNQPSTVFTNTVYPHSHVNAPELCDSSSGNGSSGIHRSRGFQKQSQSHPILPVPPSLEEMQSLSTRAKGSDSCINSGGDSSSEMSDEGYRTGGGGIVVNSSTNEEYERPDSSCTQTSIQSSLTKSEASLADASGTEESLEPPAAQVALLGPEPTEKCMLKKASKIPLLGSLRGLGHVPFQHYLNHSNKGSNFGVTNDICRPLSRSSSITSETSSVSSASSYGYHRESFGRRSLRILGDGMRMESPPVYKDLLEQQQASNKTIRNTTLAWSSNSRRKKARPVLTSEFFAANSTEVLSRGKMSKNQQRAASTSPNNRRRYFGDSTMNPVFPDTSLTTCEPANQIVKKSSPPSSKMSPLLRSMLKDVEIDNDASILKKMEEIVNQYKARVEGILAQEGKTLNDAWEPTRCSNGVVDEERKISFTPVPPPPSRLTRRNSFDSNMSHLELLTRVRPSPRKDTTTSSPSLPSKIPMPLFYRSKETCL